MDDRELELLLENLESDRVERKASSSDGQKIRQAKNGNPPAEFTIEDSYILVTMRRPI